MFYEKGLKDVPPPRHMLKQDITAVTPHEYHDDDVIPFYIIDVPKLATKIP
jgi:hypothetical protein